LSDSKPHIITLCGASSLHYLPNFINTTQATHLLEKWIDELPWEQSNITMFGKQVKIPRLNAWYGDKPYAYSGTQFEAKPMTAEMVMLKELIEKSSGLVFNSVLANWYRSGDDCMGWHSDDEASLGTDPQIASVSLGDARRFVLRQKSNKSNKRTKKSHHSRLNLTFRYIS